MKTNFEEMKAWHTGWVRSGRGSGLLPLAERVDNFCPVTCELFNLRVPMEQTLQQQHQQKQQQQQRQQEAIAAPIEPTASALQLAISPACVFEDDDFEEIPVVRGRAQNLPLRKTHANIEPDECLAVLDEDLMTAIEIFDDSADSSFETETPSHPSRSTAGSGAVQTSNTENNYVDVSELDELEGLDDFDITAAYMDPEPKPVVQPNALDAKSTKVQAEVSADLSTTIDLCSDFEDELDVIDIHDLGAGVGDESPKRMWDTLGAAAVPKRPRFLESISNYANGSGYATPISIQDTTSMSTPGPYTDAKDGPRERLEVLAKEKARISDQICDLEFTDEIGNENEISLLRQKRIDIMKEIRRLQSSGDSNDVHSTQAAASSTMRSDPVLVEDRGFSGSDWHTAGASAGASVTNTAYSAYGTEIVKPSDPGPNQPEANYAWTKD
ncbi:hypothetical protein GGH15_003966, partial [Coemansia sp. RSA 562]